MSEGGLTCSFSRASHWQEVTESKLPAGDASKAVVISHVVIDDQVVDGL